MKGDEQLPDYICAKQVTAAKTGEKGDPYGYEWSTRDVQHSLLNRKKAVNIS